MQYHYGSIGNHNFLGQAYMLLEKVLISYIFYQITMIKANNNYKYLGQKFKFNNDDSNGESRN